MTQTLLDHLEVEDLLGATVIADSTGRATVYAWNEWLHPGDTAVHDLARAVGAEA
ncbi:hypothetical protein HLRTI_002160 [Halorhabdus tiamatea SARL4B]|uniref:Uncharacterized protein n=1 Tax=Halorhabdus tiamatea SARL4B TaxID=1033806 RepID=F7PJF0_9EURY|nr:hypothetical protein [Halorhabdus tiamatea]ERJ05772.1 hypothetical protein HLRTI_002160 [Halorhabdus tiamatea SARL4B]CCQ34294.1 hypothetical protein HTIA_2182 [Halorhabdus tiamatea SARL4B]